MKKVFFLTLLFFLVFPLQLAQAQILPQETVEGADVGISSAGIWFLPVDFFAGDNVTIYARVHNYGEYDMTGRVIFYQGPEQIGESQLFSSVAGGSDEEVWITGWRPEKGDYNIRASIIDTNPLDSNPDNNEAITAMFAVDSDSDGDDIGDADDEDDDNDGLTDEWENEHGFNSLDSSDAQQDTDDDGLTNLEESTRGADPNNPDTDDDGVLDGADVFPLDPTESKDSDDDGIGDNEDEDDDNDGVSDIEDVFPFDSTRSEEEAVELPVESPEEVVEPLEPEVPAEESGLIEEEVEEEQTFGGPVEEVKEPAQSPAGIEAGRGGVGIVEWLIFIPLAILMIVLIYYFWREFS